MQPYGSAISYDTSRHPIRMIIDSSRYEAIKHKFVTDYGLPPASEEADLANNYVEVALHESVDEHTFLLHLRTMSPTQYEELEIPEE